MVITVYDPDWRFDILNKIKDIYDCPTGTAVLDALLLQDILEDIVNRVDSVKDIAERAYNDANGIEESS